MEKETELKPKGIHFKMDWDEMIMDLEDASVGKMIKNVYNYLNDRELIEMDKMETMLFKHTIKPVLEYNAEKYQKQVEHNRRVAPKGGRKPKTEETQTNLMGIIETQNIPSGSFTNPENPKDKDRDKDRDKERDKERDIEKDKTRTRLEIEKMKKLVDIDLKTIKVEEEIDFSINVKELVRILNWSRFELLIFYTSVKDVEGLLTEYDKLGCLQGILKIKEHYTYFLDKIIE
jgi:hypothetical protein